MFLTPPKPPKSFRQGRGAIVNLTAVGLSGGGLALGGSDSRGLRGIFGNCQDQSKAKADNIRRLAVFKFLPPTTLPIFRSTLMTNFC